MENTYCISHCVIDYLCRASASAPFHFSKPKIALFPQKRLLLGDGLAGK